MISKLKTDPLSHYTYSGMSPVEKPFMDRLMKNYQIKIHDAVKLAALKMEHSIDEDSAYRMLKGDEASNLNDIQNKERLEKTLVILEDAINMDRVVIYRQRIESLCDTMDMYENFIRIVKEDKTMLSPAVFLDDARELGQYTELHKIFIDKVFDYYETTNDEFSLNFSIIDILDVELVEYLLQKVSSSSASNRFIIEIYRKTDESYDKIVIKDFITRIKNYNVRVAFDDIGMSNAKFDELLYLEVDIIKIEAKLIRSMEEDENSRMFVEFMSDISQRMNLTTVAIHIERDSTKEMARELKINYAQGYAIDKPSLLEV
ncbi:EAL domain-containing protein [Sulfurimonas sp. SAG-AH-194-I05]|nr:EAL domain-containing protein [Sulfurimonas sp. SAG-AH-194-I05]MDF1875624.1 EAL domain-containing protein [Sulfurimonas sp. SAG-AH-194-I05]